MGTLFPTLCAWGSRWGGGHLGSLAAFGKGPWGRSLLGLWARQASCSGSPRMAE